MDARQRWLRFIGRRLNPLTLAAARRGRGPFTIIRHRGRSSGKVYETPIMVAGHGDDFVAELTYGPKVQWYRNVRAAGGRCQLVRGDRVWQISAVEPFETASGLRAYGPPRAWVLRLLRREHFLLLRTEGPHPATMRE
jgi:deazaflavin-dependent oxidoreductase (nitroreductase family)